jgi:hypothetical protein
MSNALEVKVTSRKSDGEEWWEGTVSLEGTKPTKLARKSDGSTRFTSRSAVQGAARRFADRYGYSDVDFGAEKPALKKAAKKSVKTTTTDSTSTNPTY